MIDHTTNENVSLRERSRSPEVTADTACDRNAVPHARDFPSHHNRRGQALVEFAVIALALYLILAAILTFGHLLYVAQGLQTAADLGAREISRTPLPAMVTAQSGEERPLLFEDLTGGCNNLEADHTPTGDPSLLESRRNFRTRVFDEAWLVIDLNAFYAENPEGSVFEDLVPRMPLLNQQLATMMIVDRPVLADGEAWLLRYPGALLRRPNPITPPNGVGYDNFVADDFAIGIPRVVGRDDDGVETIRWIPVVEEIEPQAAELGPNGILPQCDPEVVTNGFNPFAITNPDTRGVVALRINYPFQSAAMSGFREFPVPPNEGNIDTPIAADDGGVTELNPGDRPGDLTGAPLESGRLYRGTYAGQYGLGAQGALGSTELTGGRPVRPYRRVVSAQAIYRREIFQ